MCKSRLLVNRTMEFSFERGSTLVNESVAFSPFFYLRQFCVFISLLLILSFIIQIQVFFFSFLSFRFFSFFSFITVSFTSFSWYEYETMPTDLRKWEDYCGIVKLYIHEKEKKNKGKGKMDSLVSTRKSIVDE